MTKISAPLVISSLLCCGLLSAACGGEEGESRMAAAAAEPRAVEGEQESELPAGHPPVATGSAGFELPAVPEQSGTGTAGLTWEAPENWVAETPANAMRRAQYRVAGAAGDGECVVFYFGPGQGGDPMSNAQRWARQFAQPDGSDPLEALQTEQIEVGGMPVLLVEISGTYSGGMAMMGGASQSLENHSLLGAVAEGPDANWFFKFTGPAETVEAERQAFLDMIQSLASGS